MMSALRCPVCGARVDPAASTAMPFCSSRCRQIDLGRWLGEKNMLPLLRDDEGEDEGPAPQKNGHDGDED